MFVLFFSHVRVGDVCDVFFIVSFFFWELELLFIRLIIYVMWNASCLMEGLDNMIPRLT
jgi:hypothetical protein